MAAEPCTLRAKQSHVLQVVDDMEHKLTATVIRTSAVGGPRGPSSIARWSHTCERVPVARDGRAQLVLWGGYGDRGDAGRPGAMSRLPELRTTPVPPASNSDPVEFSRADAAGKAPKARQHHTAAYIGGGVDALCVFGGRTNPARVLNDTWLLRRRAGEWEWICVKTSGEVPSPRYRHTAVAIGDTRMLVWGGRDADGKCSASDVYWVLNVESGMWSRRPATGAVPAPRHSHTSVSFDSGRLVAIYGGYHEDGHFRGPSPRDTRVYVLDTATDTWRSAPASGNPPPPLFSHTATMIFGRFMLVLGASHCVPEALWRRGSDQSGPTSYESDSYWNLSTIGMNNILSVWDVKRMVWSLPVLSLAPGEAGAGAKGGAAVAHLGSRLWMQHTATRLDADEAKVQRVLVAGGGGNCYFFGPHYNPTAVLRCRVLERSSGKGPTLAIEMQLHSSLSAHLKRRS